MIKAVYDAIADRAKSITILIALGTHAAMDELRPCGDLRQGL
nr:hypothetical protein [Corynebacterium callunae]